MLIITNKSLIYIREEPIGRMLYYIHLFDVRCECLKCVVWYNTQSSTATRSMHWGIQLSYTVYNCIRPISLILKFVLEWHWPLQQGRVFTVFNNAISLLMMGMSNHFVFQKQKFQLKKKFFLRTLILLFPWNRFLLLLTFPHPSVLHRLQKA